MREIVTEKNVPTDNKFKDNRQKVNLKKLLTVIGISIVGVAIIILVVLLATKKIKFGKNNGGLFDKNGTLGYVEQTLVGMEISEKGAILCIGEHFYVADGNVIQCLKIYDGSAAQLWEEAVAGDGRIVAGVSGTRFWAYRIGEDTLWCCDEKGVVWKKTVDGRIVTADVNDNAGVAAVVYTNQDGKDSLAAFAYKDGASVNDNVIEKKAGANHIVGVAIAANGKTLAVSEVSTSETLSTKITVSDLETGKNYLVKSFDGELSTYVKFSGDKKLIVAGAKKVYCLETGKVSGSGAKMDTVCTMDNGFIRAIDVIDGFVGIIGGNGKDKFYVYNLAKTDDDGRYNGDVLMTETVPEGVRAAGDRFIVFSSAYVELVNPDCTVAGTSEKFAAISNVFCGKDYSHVVKDSMGLSVAYFE